MRRSGRGAMGDRISSCNRRDPSRDRRVPFRGWRRGFMSVHGRRRVEPHRTIQRRLHCSRFAHDVARAPHGGDERADAGGGQALAQAVGRAGEAPAPAAAAGAAALPAPSSSATSLPGAAGCSGEESLGTARGEASGLIIKRKR
jgi:hypothetical protein